MKDFFFGLVRADIYIDGKINIYICVYLYMCVLQKIMYLYTCIIESIVLIYLGIYFDCCFIELDQFFIFIVFFIC